MHIIWLRICEFSENVYKEGCTFVWIYMKLHLHVCRKPLHIPKVKTATVSSSPVQSLPVMVCDGALFQAVTVVTNVSPRILSRPPSRTQNTNTCFISMSHINQISMPTADINHTATGCTEHWAVLPTAQPTADSSTSPPAGINFRGLYPTIGLRGCEFIRHYTGVSSPFSLVMAHKCLYWLGCACYMFRTEAVTSN
jgi:hypothetical protein